MLEINEVVKAKQFLVVINLWLSKLAKKGEINAMVKVKQFLVVINLAIKTGTNGRK